MPKCKDLGLEQGSGSKSLPDERKQGENDRGHVAGKLYRYRAKFNWLNQYGVFGRDTYIVRSGSVPHSLTVILSDSFNHLEA